ncbi:hypothetical protein AXX12_14915 [Anaerosporomusa subterranea]|uniref:ABC transporter domain-containing protein n=1 Tax=Anaerosporomusa subterranea TaxID=1794912 RepID=A0A154BLU3_ANASB|nr:ABC transporter ATP-binding protein [Anaerosporomusa subterranea]KYZ74871.1 hypothetical protein AXX12_14915 [Anaerosporomusa subterranea]
MALIQANNISKQFGGIAALKSINIEVEQGEIRGLIGPNGAGKTTFFNVLAGNYTPTAGTLLFAGSDIGKLSIHERVSLGIVRTFQNIRLFSSMTVLDNVKMGYHARTSSGWLATAIGRRWVFDEEKRLKENAISLLERFGIERIADEQVGNLSYGHQRRVEIARAMAAKPKLLLLDEPAAGMNDTEGQELVRHIRDIRDQGVTIIIVEHDMRVVMSVSDHISVLAHGEIIAEGEPEAIQGNQRVNEEYLGKGSAAC